MFDLQNATRNFIPLSQIIIKTDDLINVKILWMIDISYREIISELVILFCTSFLNSLYIAKDIFLFYISLQ